MEKVALRSKIIRTENVLSDLNNELSREQWEEVRLLKKMDEFKWNTAKAISTSAVHTQDRQKQSCAIQLHRVARSIRALSHKIMVKEKELRNFIRHLETAQNRTVIL
ncbi:hypothetical protein SAMN04487911_12326 [Arenibacter nanhaiticus]|uniref:Uncharacterized protein n=1 Tax=Arenibacter nanhaiticus TaxID=558155 RepID=A0A1M6JV10_9FLAO|nr:hypothetical protein [Arenibacter nanhaiticus]SHJ50531.1 hypothetical protein SAMN04487911_12326 [Arenibacter nanhaiticus]